MSLTLRPGRSGDRAAPVRGIATGPDDAEQRIVAAVKNKKRQVRKANTPVILAISTSPFGDLEDYDRALYGLTFEEIDVDGKQIRTGFKPIGLFGQVRVQPPTIAGVLAYRDVGFTRVVDPVLYLHPRFSGTFPEALLQLQTLIEELESLVNDKSAREQDFQDFFERNPSFIINDDYKKAHPHVLLTRSDGESLIPDFVLEPADENSLSDLLELKTPLAPVFILKKARMRYSAAVLEACAQLREYSSFFDEPGNRRVIQEKYGLLAYRPKMFVVIGRKGTLDPLAVRRVEHELPNLYLRTYDDIINRMKSRLARMKQGGSIA